MPRPSGLIVATEAVKQLQVVSGCVLVFGVAAIWNRVVGTDGVPSFWRCPRVGDLTMPRFP